MATINLGRVGFVQKGTYSGVTAYKINDVVVYNNGVYACISPTTGNLPTNTTYWKLWLDPSTLVAKTGDETIAGVKTFSSSPIVPTPTAGTQAVNKDYADLKVALESFIGTNQSLSGIGYQKLPGGLILQWGSQLLSGTTGTYSYPVAFPNTAVHMTAARYGSDNTPAVFTFSLGYSSFTAYSSLAGSGFYWFAIGY